MRNNQGYVPLRTQSHPLKDHVGEHRFAAAWRKTRAQKQQNMAVKSKLILVKSTKLTQGSSVPGTAAQAGLFIGFE